MESAKSMRQFFEKNKNNKIHLENTLVNIETERLEHEEVIDYLDDLEEEVKEQLETLEMGSLQEDKE